MRFRTIIPLVFVTAILLRIPFILRTSAFIDPDELIAGIGALHIMQGESFPLYYPGQSYMAATEQYLLALAFRIFGPSRYVLALVPALIWLMLMAVAFWGFDNLAGKRRLILLMILAYPPATITMWSTRARAYMIPLLLAMSLLIASEKALTYRINRLHLFFFGLLCGFSFFSNPALLPYIATLLISLTLSIYSNHRISSEGLRPESLPGSGNLTGNLTECSSEGLKPESLPGSGNLTGNLTGCFKSGLILVGGAIIGAFPLLHGLTFGRLFVSSTMGWAKINVSPFPGLMELFVHMPRLLVWPYANYIPLTISAILPAIITAFCILWLIAINHKGTADIKKPENIAFFLYFAATIFHPLSCNLYSLHYLLLFIPALSVMAARNISIRPALLLVLFWSTSSLYLAFIAPEGRNHHLLACALPALTSQISEANITVYTGYDIAASLGFDSELTIVASDDAGPWVMNRFPHFCQIVDKSQAPFWIFRASSPESLVFQDELAEAGFQSEKMVLDLSSGQKYDIFVACSDARPWNLSLLYLLWDDKTGDFVKRRREGGIIPRNQWHQEKGRLIIP